MPRTESGSALSALAEAAKREDRVAAAEERAERAEALLRRSGCAACRWFSELQPRCCVSVHDPARSEANPAGTSAPGSWRHSPNGHGKLPRQEREVERKGKEKRNGKEKLEANFATISI